MTKISSLLVLLLILGLGGCTRIQIKAQYDKATDFSRYQTFAFIPMRPAEETTVAFSQKNQETINRAITHELESRQYRRVERDADLMISNYLTVEDKQKMKAVGYTRSANDYYGGVSGGRADVVEYRAGTLVIELVDMRNNRLVWEGVATGTAAQKLKDPQAKIIEVVGQLFDKYPVKKVTK